ncbi:putative lipid II flippase FtsW [Sutcliffiella rhizosphaerae]|uniref:Probable peptidoglycan glycosyltransferase FtsW n=1 Tax=Sutcliffiella rhizosphaerae TaxID=2880967 RepID=A0ABM8YME6_9BACI|nr:putative lipid II flippase FtsW [Sutcliffiella rhizosphaerae]CAG9621013.1 putative peptidoglycan glycosyltransferase FtsW [Sutcliffiella rhizosphaerae]
MITHFKKLDWILIAAIVLLCTYGLIMVYSAGMLLGYERHGDYAYFFNRQKDWLIIGIPVFIFAIITNYRIYDKLTPIFVGGIILGLLLVLIPFIGVEVNGSRRWLEFGFRIQPSEIAKLVMIIYFARVYARKQPYIHQFKQGIMPPLAVLVFIFFLILLQPDLGTGTSILVACGAILICSGAKWKHIIVLATIAAVSVGFLATSASYRMERLTSFIDPFGNESDTGFQLVNSFIAIGDAGIFGRGLGQGIHKLGYLPEAHTDFILAVISEELGIFGILFLFLLYLIILIRGVRIGVAIKEPFGKLLALGITFQISSQVFFNAGAVSGVLPITGITLPFISYGGSSLLITIFAAGVLVHLSKHATIAREAREETESTWGQKITS